MRFKFKKFITSVMKNMPYKVYSFGQKLSL